MLHLEEIPNTTITTRATNGTKATITTTITTVTTAPVAQMDNSFIAEFRQELPAAITREITRVALKTYFQYKLQNNYGFFAGVAGGLYQAATTAVDIRSWTALPYSFQAAHTSIPQDGVVTVSPPAGGASVTINIPSECKNVILYIRIVATGTEPAYDLIMF